jgi:hypothetical protein
MNTKQSALQLLDELEVLGFNDNAFSRLHHDHDTITPFRNYCINKIQEFTPDGTNHNVQRRLQLVLNAYRAGVFQSGREEVFLALADASVAEIPF